MSDTTPSDFKQKEARSWAAVADGWARQDELLRMGSAPVTERMLQLAGIAAGSRVLDIASGTGEPAISAAAIAGSTGRVVGTDLVDEMLCYARGKAERIGLTNIEFRCVDGETLDVEADHFDAVTIRWGLMFMPNPEACLALAHAAMKPGARISLACWSTPEKNPFISLLIQTLGKYTELPAPPAGAPGIFAFSNPQRLQDILGAAGFQDIELEEMEISVVEVENGQAYWEAMSDLAAPVMRLVNLLEQNVRAEFVKDVVETADAMRQGETLRMKGTTWIAAARK